MSAAATTSAFPVPPLAVPERTLSPGQWGMLSFLVSEVAIFSTLILTYLFYLGKDMVGPTPAAALELPLVLCTTACLLISSWTVHQAERMLERGGQQQFVRRSTHCIISWFVEMGEWLGRHRGRPGTADGPEAHSSSPV